MDLRLSGADPCFGMVLFRRCSRWFAAENTSPMKKIILTYGIIGGIIVTAMMWLTLGGENHDFDRGLWIGYTTMVIAFSTIFFAVKGYRDKHLGGSITFGKAFLLGLYITLFVSTIYVASWLVLSATAGKDYMTEYYAYYKTELESSDMPAAEVEAELADFREMAEHYKNPAVKIGFTYMEILPIGLAISLVCAGLLKRREPSAAGR